VVDRINRRLVTSLNFLVQGLGIGLLAGSAEPRTLLLGCVLFGVGVGNATSLPGLIVHSEFPKQHFTRIISIVVAVNQFTFAFGPTLLAQLQHAEGSYTMAMLLCLAMEISAAIVILIPVVARYPAPANPGRT